MSIALTSNYLRYFTGTSKNPDGSVQYVRGQTDFSNAVDGVIHIITAAVSFSILTCKRIHLKNLFCSLTEVLFRSR